jgi:glycosyltransferase involved in cell wall biosynthesis
MRIYAVHLLNDYSGSPKVLMQSVQAWQKAGHSVSMITSAGREGFLSNLTGIAYAFFTYKFSENRLRRLINLFASQLRVMSIIYAKARKNDIVYVNTVLPFGAALGAKLRSCRIIYHLHETSVKPLVLKKFLFGIMKITASDIIYVSSYLSKQESIAGRPSHLLYNAIPESFQKRAQEVQSSKISTYSHVLMVCSLKSYKGVWQYFQLAEKHPEYQFRLVVNASQQEIDDFFSAVVVPTNLTIFDTQVDLHPHYFWADMILNLSIPSAWIETFGLTIIEGMAYGLPAIVPPVGGIAELVEDGENGYHIDSRNLDSLSQSIVSVFSNPFLYEDMRAKALEKIMDFQESSFSRNSLAILNKKNK